MALRTICMQTGLVVRWIPLVTIALTVMPMERS